MSNTNITNVGKRIQEAEVVLWSVLFWLLSRDFKRRRV